MSEPINWLTSELSVVNDEDRVYDLSYLKENFKVTEFIKNGFAVISEEKETKWIKFAIMQWSYGSTERTFFKVNCIFHGSGHRGLRQCRHTYWGEDGYVFYPDGKIITAAFKFLEQYFDEMV